jgi:hypothetical protein
LRTERPPSAATLIIRGGRDTPDKLRSHAQRTARAWSLDGQPLLGISVFAALDMPLDKLLRRRFTSSAPSTCPTVSRLTERGFGLLPTGQRPHFTIHLHRADDEELTRLLTALGDLQPNPQYVRSAILREEG